jgi:hypothetical protein
MPELNEDKLLKHFVSINQKNIRSINVEYDLNSSDLFSGYTLTPQVLQSMGRIINGIVNKGSRAWILTGPYGSGKSFFSLFLVNLLNADQDKHEMALNKLFEVEPILSEQVKKIHDQGTGYFPIIITGYRASLDECVHHGIEKAILRDDALGEAFLTSIDWHQQDYGASDNKKGNSKKLINIIEYLSQKIQSTGIYKGLIFVFDEMGKALEQASFHKQENDIYLLQEIAEFINRSENIFIGVLHQSFERYASLLDNSTQREWAKVQGRFEDIPFHEPPVQQLRLFQRALSHKNLDELDEEVSHQADKAVVEGWNPKLMDDEEFKEIVKDVYPFHPSTFAILPYFFRRLAQNERSIYAFLTSQEPFGFQDFSIRNEVGTFFRLPNLFDYLLTNFQSRIYAAGHARSLSEAADRLENVQNLSTTARAIIKTIGLLNWISEITHLVSTERLIISALANNTQEEESIKETLAQLKKRSIIVFRKFNQSYIVWQGSDVDIEERIDEGLNKLAGTISLARSLEKYMPPRPMVARSHSYRTGTLRYFELRYIDSRTIQKFNPEPALGANGIFLLCLPAKLSEIDDFKDWSQKSEAAEKENLIVGITNKAIRLSELITQLAVLNWVRENTPELRDDPVARRELRERTATIEAIISAEIQDVLFPQKVASSGQSYFYHAGKELAFEQETLIPYLSEILDKNYAKSPVLWNEIINRNVPSSQAAMARKKIVHGILESSRLEKFGFEGYPPERSIYENLIAGNDLHKEFDGEWRIQAPARGNSLFPVWQVMEEIVFKAQVSQTTVQDLFDILHAEPYGLTYGVAPILLCVFLKIFDTETTLYQQGVLLSEPTLANWDVLLSRPDMFSVGGFKIRGARKKLIDRFAKGYTVQPGLMPVVRVLVRSVHNLPEHTLVTKRISEKAQAVREAITLASSPEKLLFIDLPAAIGMPEISEDTDDQALNHFFSELNKVNSELIGELDRLLTWCRDKWLKACGMKSNETDWGRFRLLASRLESRTNFTEIKPLYKRAAGSTDPLAALESVMGFIANRPPRNWTDFDTDQFKARLNDLGELFIKDQRQYAFEELLSSEQRVQSESVASGIEKLIKNESIHDKDIIKGALNILNQKYFGEND